MSREDAPVKDTANSSASPSDAAASAIEIVGVGSSSFIVTTAELPPDDQVAFPAGVKSDNVTVNDSVSVSSIESSLMETVKVVESAFALSSKLVFVAECPKSEDDAVSSAVT